MSKVVKAVVGIAAITGIVLTGGAALFAGASFASAGTWLTGTVAGRLLTSVAVSALSQALNRPKAAAHPGIRTGNTTRGDVTPDGFVLGRYATAGTFVTPPYTHGRSGHKTPNAYLQYVIHLGSAPGQKLAGMLIDGKPCRIGDDHGEIPWDGNTNFGSGKDWHGKLREYGKAVFIGDSTDAWAWVRFVDGTQTTVDGRLRNRYGNHPHCPWTDDMVGTGICYAVVTFQFNDGLYKSFPSVRFVLDGIPLYDPRLDSTAGGNGPQRWGQPATYASSENTAVQIYNLKRGIALPGGHVYGGGATAAQLPLSSWFAAMNACDALVERADGHYEPAWRTSFEINVSEPPAAGIEELCASTSIQLAEMGGVWTIRVGAPGVPVAWITDDDVLITKDRSAEFFAGFGKTHNGASVSFPVPESGWQPAEGPIYMRSDYVAADRGRELVANLSLPAAPYAEQNQRLIRAFVEEERRERRFVVALPPAYDGLEALDTITWSSSRYGFADKLFEVTQAVTDPMTQVITASLRERDPSDWAWDKSYAMPWSPVAPAIPLPVEVEVGLFSASAFVALDGSGTARRPAILLEWDADEVAGLDGIEWELRLAGGTTAAQRGSITDIAAGELPLVEGILPAEDYEVRARPVGSAFTALWSSWQGVTTDDIRLGFGDMDDSVRIDVAGAFQAVADAREGAAGAQKNRDDTLEYRNQTEVHRDAVEAAAQAVALAEGNAADDADRSEAAKAAAELARGLTQELRNQTQTLAANADGSALASKGHAETSKTHSDDAGRSAGAASAALTELNARLAQAALIPSDMTGGGANWTQSLGGAPESVGGLHGVVTSGTDAAHGAFVSIPASVGGNIHVVSKSIVPFVPNRTYTITVRARSVGGLTEGRLRFVFALLDAQYVNKSNVTANVVLRQADGWEVATFEWTVPDTTGIAYFRPGVFVSGAATPGRKLDINLIRIDDTTAATAAASHSMSAAVHANEARISAAAAANDRLATETARTRTETLRNQTVEATETAGDAAARATEQATLSTQARNASYEHAQASSGAARTAESHADAAGVDAQATAADRVATRTDRTQTEAFRNQTVAARDTASGAATTATQQAGVVSQVSGRSAGVLTDQFLGPSAGWTSDATGPTWDSNGLYPIGRTASWTLNNTTSGGIALRSTSPAWVGQMNADAYVVEVEYELVTGSIAGAAVALSWFMSAGNNVHLTKRLDNMTAGAVVPGNRYVATGVFRKPTGHTGTFDYHRLIVYANTTAGGQVLTSKTLRIHRVFVRVATAEELGGGEVGASMQAFVNRSIETFADNEFGTLAEEVSQLGASMGGLTATVQQQSSALVGINGDMSALLGFRVKAGSQGALLELVAADNAKDGPASTSIARIAASVIDLDGAVYARHLTVGQGANLLANSDLTQGLTHYHRRFSGGQSETFTLDLRPPSTSGNYAGRTYPTVYLQYDGTAQNVWGDIRLIPVDRDGNDQQGYAVEGNAWYEFSGQMSLHRAHAARLMVTWYDAAGADLGTVTVASLPAHEPSSGTNPEVWPRYGASAQAPATAAFAQPFVRISGRYSGSGANSAFVFLHKPFMGKTKEGAELSPWSNGGQTIIDGGTLTAQSVDLAYATTGKLDARNVEITEMLRLQANAALAYGKDSLGDVSDGIYFGKSQQAGSGFGFSISRTKNEKRQSVDLTEEVLRLSNARHVVTSSVNAVATTYTTSRGKTAIPSAAKKVSVKGVGGGASGVHGGACNAGGNTIVRLYDGNTLKYTMTCLGGQPKALNRTSTRGHSNTRGGGTPFNPGGVDFAQDALANTGGGGGGAMGGSGTSDGGRFAWYGGHGGEFKASDEIDVTGWGTPMIEVVIGAGGLNPTTGTAGDGAAGRVEFTYLGNLDVPADVVPLIPTAHGTFQKPSGTSTPQSFPNLGAGLWVLHNGNDDLGLDEITISPGVTTWAGVAKNITFVSSMTPTYKPGGPARTIKYAFYSMGSWG